jgi:hypothetical protein
MSEEKENTTGNPFPEKPQEDIEDGLIQGSLDISSFVLQRCWDEMFKRKSKIPLTLTELGKLLDMANGAWVLASNAIGYAEKQMELEIVEEGPEDEERDGEIPEEE